VLLSFLIETWTQLMISIKGVIQSTTQQQPKSGDRNLFLDLQQGLLPFPSLAPSSRGSSKGRRSTPRWGLHKTQFGNMPIMGSTKCLAIFFWGGGGRKNISLFKTRRQLLHLSSSMVVMAQVWMCHCEREVWLWPTEHWCIDTLTNMSVSRCCLKTPTATDSAEVTFDGRHSNNDITRYKQLLEINDNVALSI